MRPTLRRPRPEPGLTGGPESSNPVLAQATALLARREHSAFELDRKLASRGHRAEDIAKVLKDLKAHGLLSDERFAESLVSSKRERGYGPVRIRQDLQARGVAQELIDRCIDVDDPGWLDVLRETWAKKFAGRRPVTYKEWARQARFLQYRGFSSEQIRAVIQLDDN